MTTVAKTRVIFYRLPIEHDEATISGRKKETNIEENHQCLDTGIGTKHLRGHEILGSQFIGKLLAILCPVCYCHLSALAGFIYTLWNCQLLIKCEP